MGGRCGKDSGVHDPGAHPANSANQSDDFAEQTSSCSSASLPGGTQSTEPGGTLSTEGASLSPSKDGDGPDGGATLPVVKRKEKRLRSRTNLVSHVQLDVEAEYDVGDKAGEGAQGVVFRATRKRTGVMRAIKMVPKKKIDPAGFQREIDIMKRMDHPNIIRLYETFDDRKSTYLVMELCNGGELFGKIVEQGGLSESSAAIVLQQILRGVQYMHESSIAHRDLKPENFIFCTQGPIDEGNLLKLIDFGVACDCGPQTVLKETVGTPYYMAPQVVAKKYDKMCDVWSTGVIMFALLSGNVPFNGPSDQIILAKVREGIVRYSGSDWAQVSEKAKHLVKKLLTRNPKERISAQLALEHDWITHHAPDATADFQDGLVERLGAFRRKNRLKQAALTIVANEMNETQIRNLRETFTALDQNGDGLLTYREIKCGVEEAGLEVSPEVLRLFEEDMDNEIDYTEFLASTMSRKLHVSDQAIKVAFAMLDSSSSGKLSAKDVAKAFNKAPNADCLFPSPHGAEDIIKRYSSAGDGLDYEDFHRMMCHDTSPVDHAAARKMQQARASERGDAAGQEEQQEEAKTSSDRFGRSPSTAKVSFQDEVEVAGAGDGDEQGSGEEAAVAADATTEASASQTAASPPLLKAR